MRRSLPCLLPAAAIACSMAFSTARAVADEKAGAEALLGQGVKLTSERRYSEACPKFEESLRLYDSINTAYFLADCYEHVGKFASAWVNFLEVAEKSHNSAQRSKETKARARASAIESKVSRLVIHVTDKDLPGLTITREGVPVGAAQWEVPMPLDPGEYTVVASAPERTTLTLRASLAKDGSTTELTIPALAKAEPVVVAPVAASGANAAAVAASADASPPAPQPSSGRTQRIVGIALAGAGALAMGVGVGLGFSANAAYDSAPGCEGKYCDSNEGLAARESARDTGRIGTGVFFGGVGLAVAGAAVYFSAPSAKRESQARAPLWYLSASSDRVVFGGRF